MQIKEELTDAAIYVVSYFPYKIYVDASQVNSNKLILDVTDGDGQKHLNKQIDKSQNEITGELNSANLIQKGDYTVIAFFDHQSIKRKMTIHDSSMKLSENNLSKKVQAFTLK